MRKIFITSLFIGFPCTLAALEPESSTQVSASKVVINDVAQVVDNSTAYVGVRECKALLSKNRSISAEFTINFMDGGQDGQSIDNYYYFDQTRGVPTKIDCASGELCTTIPSDKVIMSGSSVKVTLDFSTLVDLMTADECTGLDKEFFIRMTTKNDTVISPNDVRFIVDTIRPNAPSELTATASEGTIAVEFVPDTDASDVKEYTIFYSKEVLVAGELAPSSANKATLDKDQSMASINVSLEPDSIQYIGVASTDEANNRSVLSNVVQTRVVGTDDFWESYKKAGGEEEGGCSSTQSNPSWLILLLGFFLLPKRKKKTKTKVNNLVITITLFCLLLLSSTAFAESQIWGSAEVKLGGILPSIDAEFGGDGPYKSTFQNESLLVGEIEFDAHLISNPIVLLGAGFHLGYGSVTAPAITADGSKTEDMTSLSVIPMRISAVARFPYLVTKFNIPFVPTLKAGLDSYRWSISAPSGDTAKVNGMDGSGWKNGWHAGLGLQFLLNYLAPDMASNFDYQWGVNRSYLFAEYMMTSIDGFGSKGFDFSDNYWNFGLAFDF